MPRTPNDRRWVWSVRMGAAVSAVLVAMWLATGVWGVQWQGVHRYAALSGGGVYFGWTWDQSLPEYLGVRAIAQRGFRLLWWVAWHSEILRWDAFVPLWLPSGVSLAATAIVWRLRKGARRKNLAECPA